MFNIAFNTFRELLRNKILTMILLFAVVLIVFTKVLATLSLGQTERIIIDFGIALIEIFGLVSVIFIGGQILFREIEGKTIYLILSKPIHRYEFLIGKFMGFTLMILLIILIQSLVFVGLLWYEKIGLDPLIFISLGSIMIKLTIVFSIILLFSTFTNPLLSIFLTIGVYISAHAAHGMLEMAIRLQNEWFTLMSKGLLTVLPPFEALNTAKNTIGTPVGIDSSIFLIQSGSALLYLGVIIGISIVIFHKKSFENA